MRETAAVREERLARVAIRFVLADRVLHVLRVQWVLQLGGEDRDAVQEEYEVEAVLVLRAVAHLANDREQARGVQTARLFVEPARRPEVREPELHAGVLESVAQHVERAAPLDFRSQSLEELLPDRCAVMLLEFLPLFRLGREHEVDDIAWQQTERAIVVLRTTPSIPAGRRLAVGRSRLQHKMLATRRAAEPVEKPLRPAPMRCPRRARADGSQPMPNRLRPAARRSHAETESRYGAITLRIRHISAARSSSLTVALRDRTTSQQRLQRYIEPDLVPITKTVDYRARRIRDRHTHTQHRLRDHTVAQHRTGKPDDAYRRRRMQRFARFPIDRQPDLPRHLRADLVNPQCREQTHYRVGDRGRDHRNRLELRRLHRREPVQPATHGLDVPRAHHALELVVR